MFMQKSRLFALAAIIFISVAATASAETLILDQTGYFRSYYRFERDMIDAQVLREQGEELLGATQMGRLRTTVERQLQADGGERCPRTGLPLRRAIDVEIDAGFDWIEHVPASFQRTAARDSRHGLGIHPPAPENWMVPDFDDSTWVRSRTPMQMGYIGMDMPQRGIRDAYQHIHTSYFRANFYVEDIRRDAPLTLSIQYRGGVRVFINGQEIARGHLPENELDIDTRAEAYPLDAYILKPDELPEEDRKNLPDRVENPRDHFQALFLARDLPINYDEAVALDDGKEPYLPREVWERIYNARERHLQNVTIPASMLKQGRNLLAIELRGAPAHPIVHLDTARPRVTNPYDWFAHSRIRSLRLTTGSGRAISSMKRPAGFQVWTQDPHERIYEPDFLEPGAPVGEIRMTAVRNGTFGSQIVVGSDRELTGFKVEVTDLAHEDGRSRISRSQIHVYGSSPRLGTTLAHLGGERGRVGFNDAKFNLMQLRYGRRHNEINHVDELTDELFDTLRADHAMLAWLSLRVPGDTAPGVYRGKATVSADGAESVQVPIEVRVIDWRVPDPADFVTFSGIGTCTHALRRLYSPARGEGIEWYGERHLQLIRRTCQLLARIGGGDWLDVAVLDNPHEIMWIRQPDGSLTFDFSNLERLLEIVTETSGKPKVINFGIMYPHGGSYRARVPVREHGSDEIEWVELGPAADPQVRESYWYQFAHALYAFLRSKGLEDRMYWGTPWDREGDPELVHLMASFLPQVHWARKSHYYMPCQHYRATSTVYGVIDRGADSFPFHPLESLMGWSNTGNYRLANSRQYSSVHYLDGALPGIGYRIKPERSLVAGYNGYGIYGAEGVPISERPPFGATRGGIGTGIVMLYWPGQDGMNTGARVKMLLEGIQETEARIFIEKALVAGILPESLAERAINHLNKRIADMEHYQLSTHERYGQLFSIHQGWRPRATELFELAAEVAQFVGLQPDLTEIELDLLAGTSIQLPLRLINSSGNLRAWQASSDNDRILISTNAGRTAEIDTVMVTIDARTAEPGSRIEGKIVVVDNTNQHKYEVAVNVRAVPAVEMQRKSNLIFARVGSQRNIDALLVNHTNEEVRWNAQSAVPWVTVSPSTGVLSPMASAPIRLNAAPPRATEISRVSTEIRLSDDRGRLVSTAPVIVYLESDHPAIPEGVEPAYLVNLDNRIAHHYTLTHRHRGVTTLRDDRPRREGRIMEAVPFEPYKVGGPGDIDEIVYDIAGSGYDTFVTGLRYSPRRPNLEGRSRFQIITDGQIRFDTGWIVPGDETIPVVVPNLREARRFTLLFTRENPMANDFGNGFWVEPRFYMVAE